MYVMWLLLGVYNTGERLFTMRKASTPSCVFCSAEVDSRVHFMLSCVAFNNIRNSFLSQMIAISPFIKNMISATDDFLLCILDPFSPRVPIELQKSWRSETEIYKVSRNFCYAMHKKRETLLESFTNTST